MADAHLGVKGEGWSAGRPIWKWQAIYSKKRSRSIGLITLHQDGFKLSGNASSEPSFVSYQNDRLGHLVDTLGLLKLINHWQGLQCPGPELQPHGGSG